MVGWFCVWSCFVPILIWCLACDCVWVVELGYLRLDFIVVGYGLVGWFVVRVSVC